MACVFCEIRDGRLPCVPVAGNDCAFGIMDINPLAEGHVLILGRVHARTLFDIPEGDLADTA